MDINLLNGNVLRYKKESCSAASSFWVAQDARGRVWAFEVGERSEVGALESLSPQKNIKINNFNNFKPTTFRSRSAIEAHRTRLASWKRSMPPLSPKITDFRGPRSFDHRNIRTSVRGKENNT
jgi:hypothetical protein